MADTYTLNTLGDLLAIPVDRLSACLRDLEYAIQFMQLVYGEDAKPDMFGPMTWTDDGAHSVHCTCADGNTLTLEVTGGGDG